MEKNNSVTKYGVMNSRQDNTHWLEASQTNIVQRLLPRLSCRAAVSEPALMVTQGAWQRGYWCLPARLLQ